MHARTRLSSFDWYRFDHSLSVRTASPSPRTFDTRAAIRSRSNGRRADLFVFRIRS
jgi:hypothetical protein